MQRREVLTNQFLVLKQRECSSSTRVPKRKEGRREWEGSRDGREEGLGNINHGIIYEKN